jgi:hypothetical protein
MNPFTYDQLPARIVFGAGRLAEVGAEVDRLGSERGGDGRAGPLEQLRPPGLPGRDLRDGSPIGRAPRPPMPAPTASCASAGGRRPVLPRRSP